MRFSRKTTRCKGKRVKEQSVSPVSVKGRPFKALNDNSKGQRETKEVSYPRTQDRVKKKQRG